MTGISKKQWGALAALVFGAFVGILNQTLLTPAFPSIMAEYSVNTSTVQWLTTGFTLVNAIMIPITAYLTDRYPIRTLATVSMAVFTVGAFMAAIAPSFMVLLIGRLLQAAGAGILFPLVSTVMMLLFPLEKRGQAMGVFGLVVGVAPAIGPVLSGLVIDHASWHDLFFVITVLGIVDAILTFVFSENLLPTNEDAKLDKLSVVESSLGFGMMLYGFSSISSGNAVVSIATTIAGIVFVVLFFRRQTRLEHPMLRVDVLKSRQLRIAIIIGMIVQMSLLSFGIILPIYLQSMRGYSATVSGLVLLPGTIVMAIMSPISGRLFDRYGARPISVAGTTILAVTTCWFAFLGDATEAWVIAAVYAVRLLGLAMVNMPIFTWGMNALDNSLVNHGNALMNTMKQVAGSFGGAILVVVMDMCAAWAEPTLGLDTLHANILGVDAAFGVSGVLCIIACVLTFAFVREKGGVVVPASMRTSTSPLRTVMKRDVYTIDADSSVLDAVRMLVEKKISAVPVLDKDGKLYGFISDGDVLRFLSDRTNMYTEPTMMITQLSRDDAAFDDKLDALMGQSVSEVAHKGTICVNENADISEVCRVLGDTHLKKVPVVDDSGGLVGMVNRSDITKYAFESYLNRVSTPSPATV
jgi:DHA2 family multidrug resistance protein-like MFS transporter